MRKYQILDIELNHFIQYGYHGTSTKKIAQEAGRSSGLMFHYFPNKLALYETLVEIGCEKLTIDCGEDESPLFVELRRLTKSVWPCVILHSMEDAVPTMLFVTANVFKIKGIYSVMLDQISGILSTVLIFFIGLSLRKYRIKIETGAVDKTLDK